METLNLEWCLKPITNLLKISGIPTHDGRKTRVLLQIVITIIVVLSLFTNLFFNGYWFINELEKFWKRKISQTFATESEKGVRLLNFLHILTVNVFQNTLPLAIPLLFSIDFYCADKWKQILNCMENLDLELRLPIKFYRNCRKRNVFIIIMLLMVYSPLVYWLNILVNYHLIV